MQNYFRFFHFRPYIAVLFCLCACVLIVLCVPPYKSVEFQQISTPVPYDFTLYKQLKTSDTPVIQQKIPQNQDTKMNNIISNHAENTDISAFTCRMPTVEVLHADQNTVETMDLETYTLCALVAEMPQNFEMQALMAQAVACRTFAVRLALDKSKHRNADICTDFGCCQAFLDVRTVDFDYAKAKQAVDATKGIIAVYENEPILAAFHAASFRKTKSSAEVWGGACDYLVSVPAMENKSLSAFDVSVEKSVFLSALAPFGFSENFTVCTDADGICTGLCEKETVLSPQNLMHMFGLRSDSFTLQNTDTGYVFTCYGYGHGVGMSQHGANILAQQGKDFYEILKYYYTGITFAVVDET